MNRFAQDLKEWANVANATLAGVVKRSTFSIMAKIIARTPVDTGRLKGNWQYSQNSSAAGQLNVFDTTPAGREGGPTDRTTWTLISAAPPFIIHTLTNNLPYAIVVEYGLYPVKGGGKKGGATRSPAKAERRAVERKKSSVSRLAGGYSSQAPTGMVRVSILEFQAAVQDSIAYMRSQRRPS